MFYSSNPQDLKCSVAMATYNGEIYIKEMLDSILNQERRIDEIVVSDDASSDNTLKIIHEYELSHPEVQWKVMPNNKNVGWRQNFRKAINACTGDIIFFSDQDDVWIPRKVSTTIEYFRENPQIKVLISDYKKIDKNGVFLAEPNELYENLTISDTIINSKLRLSKIPLFHALYRTQGHGCATAISREIAELYKSTTLNWAHDHLCDVIGSFHDGLWYTKDQLFYHRLHDNNVFGQPVGGPNVHNISFKEKIYIILLAVKYSFFRTSGEECRNSTLDL